MKFFAGILERFFHIRAFRKREQSQNEQQELIALGAVSAQMPTKITGTPFRFLTVDLLFPTHHHHLG